MTLNTASRERLIFFLSYGCGLIFLLAASFLLFDLKGFYAVSTGGIFCLINLLVWSRFVARALTPVRPGSGNAHIWITVLKLPILFSIIIIAVHQGKDFVIHFLMGFTALLLLGILLMPLARIVLDKQGK